ncbi:nuclear transport factor 2 family protein [Microlunatus antarcticus]|uniref:SnoaL-like domain-containing protein n=1 Tax=Microlunatus antarcticus TaxID=53388 RepID=A0A7W5JZY5_9ACTN|nr:nuclear transport factor 2 family protein [Microlunatus antarcticus]MBB3328817.1 hypothetical protein [Microlunatus antarcticus]
MSDASSLIDRLAIRELVDAYAHHADRREPEAQAGVFTEDGQVRLFQGDPTTHEADQVITGRADLAATFDHLIRQYDATTYPNAQSTVSLDGDTASGDSYCLAHHLTREQGERVLIVMAIRYLDEFRRTDEGWRIARRDLVFDWTDRRTSRP